MAHFASGDSPCTRRSIISQITCKSGNGWSNNNHTEFATLCTRPDTRLNDCLADGVMHWLLLIAGSCDEELVFNINVMLSFGNQFFVCVLNAVLGKDATAPIGTTSHDLSMNRSLRLTQSLVSNRSERVTNVFANGMLGSLDRNEIFVFALSALQGNPIETLISLVLIALAKVPAKHEMLSNVVDAWADDAHGNVVPRHATIISLAELVLCPIIDTLEIHDSVVVVILPGKDGILDTRWSHVRERMLLCVPSAKAKIKTTNEGKVEVNDDELLVMGL